MPLGFRGLRDLSGLRGFWVRGAWGLGFGGVGFRGFGGVGFGGLGASGFRVWGLWGFGVLCQFWLVGSPTPEYMRPVFMLGSL